MKRLLQIFTISILVLSGCSKDNTPPPTISPYLDPTAEINIFGKWDVIEVKEFEEDEWIDVKDLDPIIYIHFKSDNTFTTVIPYDIVKGDFNILQNKITCNVTSYILRLGDTFAPYPNFVYQSVEEPSSYEIISIEKDQAVFYFEHIERYGYYMKLIKS